MMSLLRLVVALALPPLLGWLLTRLLAGGRLALSRLEWLALSWGLGWGLLTLGMFGLGEAGIAAPWRPLPLLVLWLLLAAVLLALNTVCVPGKGQAGAVKAPRRAQVRRRVYANWRVLLAIGAALLVAAQCVVVVVHALALPVNGEDAWSIWAFKARIFYLSQSIPAGYFHDTSKLFSHPDYPLLVPLAETWLYGWLGRVDDWAMLLLFPPFFVGLLAIVAGALSRAYGRAAGLIGAAILVCVPFLVAWGSMGDADVPLTLAAAGSVALLWRWLRGDGGWRALALSGALSGLSAWTKKEGLILFALTTLVVALAAWRRPGAYTAATRAKGMLAGAGCFAAAGLIVAGPWLLFVAVQHPLTRDFLPFTVATLLAHLDRVPTIASFVLLRLLDVRRWNVVWVLAAAVALVGRRRPRQDRALGYLLLLLAAQLVCDGAIFIFSDWQPFTYHMATAFDRLLLHALPLAVIVLVGLATEQKKAARCEIEQASDGAADSPLLVRSA